LTVRVAPKLLAFPWIAELDGRPLDLEPELRPHRPLRHPQIRGDLRGAVPAGEPPGRIQPQPLPLLLLGGRIPATLRIPHALVIRQRPPGVTTSSRRALRVQGNYHNQDGMGSLSWHGVQEQDKPKTRWLWPRTRKPCYAQEVFSFGENSAEQPPWGGGIEWVT